MIKAKSVSAYINGAPQPQQRLLKQMRAAVTTVAPKADEKISYGMPYYGYYGRLAYFAWFKDHVSFFVMYANQLSPALQAAMKPYRTGKATLQFALTKRLPVGLIKKLVLATVKTNEKRRSS